MIFTLIVYNNYTHTRYIGVGSSVWAPLQCVLCECSCCEGDVYVSFPVAFLIVLPGDDVENR
jgi:hypothetical protein